MSTNERTSGPAVSACMGCHDEPLDTDGGPEANFDVVEFCSLSEEIQDLFKRAIQARKYAYAPYSNFAVGSALITECCKIYSGCNIENSTLSPTICAERVAVIKAVSEGHRHLKAVTVVANQSSFTAPCGMCRQTLSEFRGSGGDIDIYLSRPTLDTVLCTTISQLLPLAFVDYQKDNIKDST